MIFSAVSLGDAHLASVANLLLGGAWAESLEQEVAIAYDFLCDLYLETGRDDVQRTAEFLGRCQTLGIETASALEFEESPPVPPPDLDWLEFDDDVPHV